MAMLVHPPQANDSPKPDDGKMRIISACLAGWVLITATTVAASPPIDYARVVNAKISKMQGLWVRFLDVSGSPCFTIQIFKSASLDTLIRHKEICSIGGKRFSSDFSYVGITEVQFKADHLSLKVEIIHAPPNFDFDDVRTCSVPIRNGTIGDLVC
ncbi:hypothetical protein [Stenotrophomonas hibiscicola]|uniref:hypothetical protein n=1 Tax=Stenotrophomonas hibiscicola TaxID=86189 RepID=UPI0013DD3A39|nr:hypothetical protein [[Pseudomonas] hibiscicola]